MGFLAGADGWSITNVAAFLISQSAIALLSFIIRSCIWISGSDISFVAAPVFNRNCGYAFEELRGSRFAHGFHRFAPSSVPKSCPVKLECDGSDG